MPFFGDRSSTPLNGYQYFRLAQSDRWQLQTYDQLSQIIPLESLNVELPLLEIYRRVSFAAAS